MMRSRLVIDGNAVYEVDIDCLEKKNRVGSKDKDVKGVNPKRHRCNLSGDFDENKKAE